MTYHWRTAEGVFAVGYIQRPEILEAVSKQMLDAVRDGIMAATKNLGSSLASETDITLDGYPGRELKINFSDGVSIARIYIVRNRIYQLIASLSTANRDKAPNAIRILNSFKLISQADVEADMRKKAAEATPSPLPQMPITGKLKSDAEDEGLRGKVRTVTVENEDLSGTWSVGGRKKSAVEHYNEQGNLTKRESFDYRGNPSDITVYGYLDGNRVSNTESIQHNYNPPPMLVAAPAGEAAPKYDSRYSYKFTYKYDGKGNLIEEVWYGNDGKLWLRYVYNFKGNQKERLVYSADGSLNQRSLHTLDAKGNEVEEIIYEPRDNSIRSKYSYVYEFDAKGNWTKRTASKRATKDGSALFEPYSVTYRTITYYE